jgi:polysaccharide biosynthesis/export protein
MMRGMPNMLHILLVLISSVCFVCLTPGISWAEDEGMVDYPQSAQVGKKPASLLAPSGTGPVLSQTVSQIKIDLSNYLIGPEDILKISVWKDESLSKETLVRPDGNISFPLIGEIMASNKTVEELQKEVTQRLVPFISDPSVNVEMIKVNNYKIYVLGRVNKSGEYLVGHPPDVLQVLSMAGGLTPFASENKIKIFRRKKEGEETFNFRLGDVKSGKNLDQNILLMPGDEVVVP